MGALGILCAVRSRIFVAAVAAMHFGASTVRALGPVDICHWHRSAVGCGLRRSCRALRIFICAVHAVRDSLYHHEDIRSALLFWHDGGASLILPRTSLSVYCSYVQALAQAKRT